MIFMPLPSSLLVWCRWWGEEGRLTGSRRRSNNSLVSIVITVFFWLHRLHLRRCPFCHYLQVIRSKVREQSQSIVRGEHPIAFMLPTVSLSDVGSETEVFVLLSWFCFLCSPFFWPLSVPLPLCSYCLFFVSDRSFSEHMLSSAPNDKRFFHQTLSDLESLGYQSSRPGSPLNSASLARWLT